MRDAIPSPSIRRTLPVFAMLGVAILALGATTILICAPDLPRRLLATSQAPPPLGDAPVAIASIGGDLAGREPRPDWSTVGRVATASPIAPIARPRPAPAPDAPAIDDSRAVAQLAEAEQRYAAMDWELAASLAGRVATLPCRPATAERAASIARGAVALQRLFRELDDRDELQRNWDTHPSLLALQDAGGTTLFVPILSLDDPVQPVVDDPVAWTGRLRAAGTAGCFLLKGANRFAKAQFVPGPGTLSRVDQEEQAARLGQQLDRSLARITGDPALRDDPNAWYEAGKFAYRNRLDARVTPLLDRAFRLDPDLATTVREGNAGALFGSLVGHMKSGNRKQADAFMAAIERRYADTAQAKLARLYYHGRTAELLAAVREQTPPAAPVPTIDTAAAAAPDLQQARQWCDQGSKPYLQAMGMDATDERNRLYHEAASLLRRAKDAYRIWCDAHPEDATAAAELIEAGRMEAAARKYGTM